MELIEELAVLRLVKTMFSCTLIALYQQRKEKKQIDSRNYKKKLESFSHQKPKPGILLHNVPVKSKVPFLAYLNNPNGPDTNLVRLSL
jgi:hypothetical protein